MDDHPPAELLDDASAEPAAAPHPDLATKADWFSWELERWRSETVLAYTLGG